MGDRRQRVWEKRRPVSPFHMKKGAPHAGRGDPYVRHATSSSKAGNGKPTRPTLLGAAAAASKGVIAPRRLQCFSVACNDMPRLEFGDKIVLPAGCQKVLLELQCFKVATPMLFHIRAFGAQEPQDAQAGFTQYCSVQEFSAPDGQVFIPYWMMQNLRITEGSDVVITNVIDIPRGIYCRLQPEDACFLDIAAEIGPKLLMESALRRYSVLSTNETILIDHGDKRFYVKVLELKPRSVVSLLGDVDLEMDFAAPPQSDPKRPKSATENATTREQTSGEKPHGSHRDDPHSSMIVDGMQSGPMGLGVGRRLLDGACITVSHQIMEAPLAVAVAKKSAKLGSSSFQAAMQRIEATGSSNGVITDRVAARADTDALAKDVKLAQGAFASEGHRLGGRSDPLPAKPPFLDSASSIQQQGDVLRVAIVQAASHVCEMCLSEIAQTNAALHAVRCARNPSYHKYKCIACHKHVFKRDQAIHVHCTQCEELFVSESALAAHLDIAHATTHACNDCGAKFTQAGLDQHSKSSCAHALELCKLCGFRLKRKEMTAHAIACASRTEKCEVCHKYTKIVDMDAHLVACTSDRESTKSTPSLASSKNQLEESSPATPSVGLECVYCAKHTFTDRRQLERHVNQECLVARSFRAPASTAKLSSDPADITVKMLIQGKIKRREDARLLSESASGVSFDTSLLQNQVGSQHDAAPSPPFSRRADPHVRNTLRDRPAATTLHPMRKHKPAHNQNARPPVQLASLPTKPTQPQLLVQLDAAAGLFISSTATTTAARASIQSQSRQQQSMQRGTRKLQAISRPVA